MANSKSSLVQIAQDVLDEVNQAYKVNIVASSGAGGLATEATLLAVEDAVDGLEATATSIDGKTPALVSGRVPVDGSGVTQPVSAASLPLPTGASTSANQTTANASLSSIDTKTPALGQALAADSTPVVLTAAQITTLTPFAGGLTDTQLRASAVSVSATDLDIRDLNSVSDSVSVPGVSTAANQSTANASLSAIDASLNDIESVIEVVGYGSPAAAQRNASMLGVGTTAVSDSNPVPTKQIQSNFGIPVHDYIGVTYPDADTEVYTYKTGGAAGTTVAVVTVDYSDSTKANITAVTRT